VQPPNTANTSPASTPAVAAAAVAADVDTPDVPDPHTSHSGTRTYVVSEPDVSHKPYQVPSGAYPISAPYIEFAGAAATGADAQKGAGVAVGESAGLRKSTV